jgi:hypothetical protein
VPIVTAADHAVPAGPPKPGSAYAAFRPRSIPSACACPWARGSCRRKRRATR